VIKYKERKIEIKKKEGKIVIKKKIVSRKLLLIGDNIFFRLTIISRGLLFLSRHWNITWWPHCRWIKNYSLVKASPVIQAMTFFSINSINHREKPIFMLMQAIPLFYASHPMGCITVYSQIIDLHSYLEIYTKCPSPISACNKFLF